MDIVFANRSHIAEICRIENENFSMPWSEQSFASELDSENSIFASALDGEKVCGFAVVRYCLDEGELFNISVDKAVQNAGIGSSLMRFVLEEVEKREVNTIFLEARCSNMSARHLYEKFGFKNIGIRKGYYDMPKEDAVLMMRKSSEVEI